MRSLLFRFIRFKSASFNQRFPLALAEADVGPRFVVSGSNAVFKVDRIYTPIKQAKLEIRPFVHAG